MSYRGLERYDARPARVLAQEDCPCDVQVLVVVPHAKGLADGPSSPSAATGLPAPSPLHSPSPREEVLVQLIHTFICSQVPLLAADDGDVHHIRRIVVDEYRLGGGIIRRRHEAARRPPQEETHAHTARGTRKIWSRQHGTDDSEVCPPVQVRPTVLQSVELAAGGQLNEAGPQELQLGLIVPDLDSVHVAAVA